MKKPINILLILVSLSLISGSCKKLVEDKKRDLLVQAMTSGQWHVETFQEGTSTVTDQFSGYNFQFYEDGTVSSVKDASKEEGVWTSDIQNYSIMSDFPSAGEPVNKLNGTWKITDTETDYVVAEMSSPQGKNVLHLRKNP